MSNGFALGITLKDGLEDLNNPMNVLFLHFWVKGQRNNPIGCILGVGKIPPLEAEVLGVKRRQVKAAEMNPCTNRSPS